MNLELREPPRAPAPPAASPPWTSWAALVLAALAVALLAWPLLRPGGHGAASAGLAREVGAKLKAAGVLDQAAGRYESYLAAASEPAAERAAIAYSLGAAYLDQGRYSEALRWLYEAETLGPGELASATASKIVECLERLGKPHAAEAALKARSGLGGSAAAATKADDPIVATISGTPIYRSTVQAELDALPPEVASQLKAAGREAEMVKKVVGDELLLRKAEKLGIEQDPTLMQTLAALRRQALIARFLEREVFAKIAVADSDLENFFAANRARYTPPAKEGTPAEEPTLADLRPRVERDYRLQKAQGLAQQMIESELATQDVKMYPERLGDGK